tara:strand:+ start:868 stop:2130 length:1263 start_codon:yes stop_codon:yes gene_type:complete
MLTIFKKIVKFIKSWHFLDENEGFSCVVCGSDDFNQRKFFKSDYIFADILESNPIIKRYFFSSLKVFFKNLNKIKLSTQNLRFLFLVSSLTPLILDKNIKTVICFIDYYKIGKIFKLVLGNKINLIGFQFSVRGFPTKRDNMIKQFDYYYLWDVLDKNSEYKDKKLIKFGSLKSYIALEKYNKWNFLDKDFKEANKIILISSVAENYTAFFKKFLLDKKLSIEEKLKSVIEKFEKREIDFIREQLQAFDFFRLAIILKEYLIKTQKPLEIIIRGTNKDINKLKYEKIILNKLFDNERIKSINLVERSFLERVNYALENKNEVFVTDCSSFGKEILALGCKVIFYSNIGNRYVPFYYDYNTVFCSNNIMDNFEINIEKLIKFSKSDFINELKKAKKTFSSFTPDVNKLNNFLNQSNLSIIK